MSYQIIYANLTVRLAVDCYIPLVLWGSNNAYEASDSGRGMRRERHWSTAGFLLKDKSYLTKKEIGEAMEVNLASHINSENTIEDVMANFPYYSGIRHTSGTKKKFKSWKNLFVNSTKNAISIEDLRNNNVLLYMEDGELRFYFNSLDELDCALVTLRLQGITPNSYSIKVQGYPDRIVRSLKIKRRQNQKVVVEVKEYYLLEKEGGKIFVKQTRNGYSYAWYNVSQTKRFITLSDAEAYCKKYSWQGWTPKLINGPERIALSSQEKVRYNNILKSTPQIAAHHEQAVMLF